MFRDVPFTNHAQTLQNATISLYRAVYYNGSGNVHGIFFFFLRPSSLEDPSKRTFILWVILCLSLCNYMLLLIHMNSLRLNIWLG